MTASPGASRARLVALLKSRSVLHGDFLLASERRSPHYVDCRRTTMHADGLALIGELGLAAIRDAGWSAAAVGGLTLGADPVAYAIARASAGTSEPIHAFTVRKAAKTHGAGRRIEGCFEAGMRVVVVEDVVTTGASALEAAAAVREAGGTVCGVLAVVDREEGGREAIERYGYAVRALVTLGELLGGG
ncbi:MAG: orotate phosphoribosyltransferase [Gemmatimonadales bacterium]